MKSNPVSYLLLILGVLIISTLFISARVSLSNQEVGAKTASESLSGSRTRTLSRSSGRQRGGGNSGASLKGGEQLAEMVLPSRNTKGLSASPSAMFSTPQESAGGPQVIPIVGPVSQDQDLRTLPFIPQVEEEEDVRLMRHPPSATQSQEKSDPIQAVKQSSQAVSMPAPSATFPGITSAQSACGCLPPDTDGDVGPNHYIQAVNSRIKIIDKTGTQLLAPTTYNSFFSALGPTTPCGNNQNQGDGVVFYDHMANRWVVSDFAFAAFPGAGFYQCVGVSKTADPVAGGWWLYAVQVDPANPTFLGDYPKFGLWTDAYYFAVNLFSNNTTFNGVRVFALPRTAMVNGTGAPNAGAVAFTIAPADLGDAYSLVPATFRTGSPPPGGQPEYFMAVNSSAVAGTVENKVFTWRFHVDFTTPANSTFGVGANHTPDANVTVNNFVDAFTSAGTTIVPQNGTTRTLDTLGDKLMANLVYQRLGGVESLYATQTVNNNQGGTGPTAIRWYQFTVTGNTIPATPAQQQTFNNAADGLWRFMPSIAVDAQGNVVLGYAESSATTEPAIAYAGRLAGDPANTLAQGEAILQAGAGHQTSTSGRWGDYSATSLDPNDNCTFWHTNEYYSATSGAAWNTRIGKFSFPGCNLPTAANGNVSGQITDNSGRPVEGVTVVMGGTQSRLAITDSNGNYGFDGIEINGLYTLTPSRANYVFSPSRRSFSPLGIHTDAGFTAAEESSGVNPLDATAYFVREQYLDFLGREPDPDGLQFWVNDIETCGNDAHCREVKRIDTSSAFFFSIEFQQTGYLVERMYKAAYGNLPGAPVPLTLAEFRPDTQDIGRGVVVNQGDWASTLELNKRGFAAEFVQRPRFALAYPTSMSPAQFVDTLFANAAFVPADNDRAAAIEEFGSGSDTSDLMARGRALRRVAENSTLQQQEFNRAFVLMQYFGYLRRDPNSGPDSDFSGYNFWLSKLDQFGGDFRGAEMVRSFLVSGEYRNRFPR